MSRRRPVESGDGGLQLLVAVLVGAALGLAFVLQFGARFAQPTPIDMNVWNVTSPGLQESVTTPGLGRGSHVVDGALTIRQHAFFRADILSPKNNAGVQRIEVALADDSQVARVQLRGDGRIAPQFVSLAPGYFFSSYARTGWQAHEASGPFVIEVEDGTAWLRQDGEDVNVGNVGLGTFELSAEGEEARFASVRAIAADGSVIVADDYSHARPGPVPMGVGALVGAIVGVLLLIVAQKGVNPVEGGLAALLLLVPPLAVGLVPSTTWLAAVERLYLARTPAWDLATFALALSLLPLLAASALRSGLLVPNPAAREAGAEWAWIAGAVAAAVFASRDFRGWEWLALAPGLVFVLLPVRVARLASLEQRSGFAADLPALLALAVLGWKGGLLLACGWRVLVLAASARALLDRAPRAAADLLSVLMLAGPASCELAVRATYLDTGWDAARLSGEVTPTTGWRDPTPFWSGRCGEADTEDRHVVVYAGGSSTGGAYQFRGDPDAFFPARVHERMCTQLPAGQRLASVNFADSGRDTYTISRTIDLILERGRNPDVLVLYTGVNDLIGTNNTKTRKQREAAELARGETMKGAAGLAMRSRLLTGMSLWTRPQEADVAQVPEVPLADAEENLRLIAAAAEAKSVKVLLLTEYTNQAHAASMEPYAAMEKRLADELPNVEWFDVRAALTGIPEPDLLLDMNHLTKGGSDKLAEVILPSIAGLLGLPTAQTAGP